MHVAPAGDNAVLVELGDVTAAELHAAAAGARAQERVVAVIPGHSSLYVIFEGEGVPRFSEALQSDRDERDVRPPIRVWFGAPDLDAFLAHAGIPRDAFLDRVAALELTVRYLGFRGGFGYLDGWPEVWAMPRRPTSRARVPRGTFAIAGTVAGFYPVDSPGGWNLLGRTDENLEYALAPGDRIRIEPVPSVSAPPPDEPREPLRIDGVELLAAPLATLAGTRDWSRLERGRPAGGPFDDMAAALAMRAVTPCRALVECAMAGPRLRARRDLVIAWCPPDLDVRVARVRSGETLDFGRIAGGLRAYLAIGDEEGIVARVNRGDRHVIRAMAGPHDAGIREVECEVTPQLDRVGVRLRPLHALDVAIPADLRSCGMQCGTVQLHPDGSLVAMGPDHPVTGGYLQPMTVLEAERWKLAQFVPGERIVLRCE